MNKELKLLNQLAHKKGLYLKKILGSENQYKLIDMYKSALIIIGNIDELTSVIDKYNR